MAREGAQHREERGREGNSKNSISLHQQLSFGWREGRARKERGEVNYTAEGRERGGSLIIELGEHGDPSLHPMALGLI
jgi:hypothetical protein